MVRTDSSQSMLDPQRVRIWDQHHRGLVTTVRCLILDGVKHSGNRHHRVNLAMGESMSVSVIVCKGCCCGNLEKGYDEVPVEFLEQAWVENNLGEEAQLTISGCLGPCSMRNVVLLKSEDGLTWLGGLSGQEDYESLVNWAREYSRSEIMISLPEGLQMLGFERDEDSELIDIKF